MCTLVISRAAPACVLRALALLVVLFAASSDSFGQTGPRPGLEDPLGKSSRYTLFPDHELLAGTHSLFNPGAAALPWLVHAVQALADHTLDAELLGGRDEVGRAHLEAFGEPQRITRSVQHLLEQRAPIPQRHRDQAPALEGEQIERVVQEWRLGGAESLEALEAHVAGLIKGDDLAFSVVRSFQGNEVKINYKGKVTGAEIKFTSQREGGDRTQEFVAKKATS